MTPEQLAATIDHTLLNPTATAADVERLCTEAVEWGCASVCVLPYFVPTAYRLLRGTPVAVCSVVAFPLGATTQRTKVAEAEDLVMTGARELDMVINLPALLNGDDTTVEREVAAVASVVHRRGGILKVILECGFLSPEQQARATQIASRAGADFVKTSTGFLSCGATVEDVQGLRSAAPPPVRVKASGGIRTYDQALALLRAGADRLGTSATAAIIEEARQRITKT
ncbi:MAG: deoxyribose-phosphate aldolase [Bacteroidota bacterium]|nr:deoxyribose-phosphate aldolase [Bacteroidota bacterium]